uniref:Uncharacterized protein n=1 Tax=Caenorhabditis japonica TaxID=281687 RepID=A0A8R1IMZ0_CAEJA
MSVGRKYDGINAFDDEAKQENAQMVRKIN